MTSSPVARRSLLTGAAAAAVTTASIRSVSAVSSGASPPVGSDGAASGPSAADWRALARSIDGDVVRRADSDFDEAKELFNPRFDGTRPLAVIEATSAADVSEAIRFARRFDLRSRPKAGGHSYVGASTVQAGLVIDVGRIKQVRYSGASKTARVGAGAGLYHVHAALARHHRTIPTGTCPTVGAAGLTLGGGLGVASREHGLTCDQLVALTMVTADGTILKIDDQHHRPLMWAARGGGGGNFGIVTSLRFNTQAARRTGFFLLTFPWSEAPAVLRGWARRVESMPRSSWANLHLEASSNGSTVIRVVGTCRAGDQDAEARRMQAEAGVDAQVSTFERSFLDGVSFLGGGTTSARQEFAAGSDIVKRMTPRLSRLLPRIVAARAADGGSVAAILDPLTGAVQDPKIGDTAFPWRRHLCDIQWYIGLPSGASAASVRRSYRWIDSAHDDIRRYASGAYINYLEPSRPLGQYYGANYARLRKIKAKVDPDGFFKSHYTIR